MKRVLLAVRRLARGALRASLIAAVLALVSAPATYTHLRTDRAVAKIFSTPPTAITPTGATVTNLPKVAREIGDLASLALLLAVGFLHRLRAHRRAAADLAAKAQEHEGEKTLRGAAQDELADVKKERDLLLEKKDRRETSRDPASYAEEMLALARQKTNVPALQEVLEALSSIARTFRESHATGAFRQAVNAADAEAAAHATAIAAAEERFRRVLDAVLAAEAQPAPAASAPVAEAVPAPVTEPTAGG